MNDETIKLLKQKHPRSADVFKDIFLPDQAETACFIKYEPINAEPSHLSQLNMVHLLLLTLNDLSSIRRKYLKNMKYLNIVSGG